MKTATETRERISQLLLLMLSSDQSGEVIAAQLALKRTLTNSGLDIFAVADSVAGGQTDRNVDWFDQVEFCARHRELLTDWERGFINSMTEWRGTPTPKQAEQIDKTYRHVRLKQARQANN